MMEGILIVDKGKEMTSHDVVAILRGVTKQKRIGHTGTLDPDVTGVLPLCFGKATRLADYISSQGKSYDAEFEFGYHTDTLDSSGDIVDSSAITEISTADLEATFRRFLGEIQQLPPMYSAVKKDGVRLYDLARKGIEVTRTPRTVTIEALEITEILRVINREGRPATKVRFTCDCSKGTYMRSLIDDIGTSLGTFATMTSLRRMRVAEYPIKEALPIEAIKTMSKEDVEAHLLPMDSGVQHLPALRLDERRGKRVRNGLSQRIPDLYRPEMTGEIRVYDRDRFIGLGHVVESDHTKHIVMDKVLASDL